MSRTISYFSDYHGGENRITNYCGLMMKMLYEESPDKFENFIGDLLSMSGSTIDVGPRFMQQVRKRNSIPDLCISQQSFDIYFETKISDWFHKDQIQNHIKGFNDVGTSILVLLCASFESKTTEMLDKIKDSLRDTKVVEITFEEFIVALSKYCTSSFLSVQLEEFSQYLDRQNLLQTWMHTLNVVNCATSWQNIVDSACYCCPDTGRTYSHKRTRYFGTYKDKCVQYIYEIDAVVSVSENGTNATIKWCNADNQDEKAICNKAKETVKKYCHEENKIKPMQVFILGERREVNFKKDSTGGMWGTKLYFKNIAKGCKGIDDFAELLKDKTWSDLGH